MLKLNRKMKKFEKAFNVQTKPEEYYVLIRRKRNFILDSAGLPISKICRGTPTNDDHYGVWTDAYEGPFSTQNEAEDYLTGQLETLKKEDPKRFAQLGEMQRLIRPEPEVKK